MKNSPCSRCGQRPAKRRGRLCGACWRVVNPNEAAEQNVMRRIGKEQRACALEGCEQVFVRKANQLYCSRRCKNRAHWLALTLEEQEAQRQRWRARDKGRARPDKRRAKARAQQRRYNARASAVRRASRLQEVAARLATWSPSPPPLMLACGTRLCPTCGGSLPEGAHGNRTYCSPECYAVRRQELQALKPGEPRRWVMGWCREDGRPFVVVGAGYNEARFCSERCSSRYDKRADRWRRSRRIRAAGPRDPVNLPVLARRDDWRCHLCGGKVTREDWSVDHLTPLSKGGAHTYANVKLAHHWCNALRRDRGDAEWFAI